ncbi:MAG: hypothetical protein M3Q79_04375, partial [bacterium]|nr:hypothetical protein [bacterium]
WYTGLNMTHIRGGYTILEVMIFLAISGLIFVSAAAGVNGRQQRVQYTQSIRDFEGQMEDVLNDVAAGYYPAPTGFECRALGGGNPRPDFTTAGGTPDEHGGSDDCISVGKAVLFNLNGNNDADDFALATLVGVRPSIESNSKVAVESTNPKVAYDNNPGNPFDLTEFKGLRFGLRVTGIYDIAPPYTSYGAIVIASGFDSSSASIKNGLSETRLYALTGNLGLTMQQYVDELDGLNSSSIVRPLQGVEICVEYPGDAKKARIIVGEGGIASKVRSELDLISGLCS